MTPRSAAFPVFGSVASEVSETFALRLKNLIDPEEDTANSYPFLKIEASNLKYFSVHLVVAAVADGILETNTSPRKGRSILDQLTKNVSKEQNQVVNLVSENHNIPLKMRVFVKASVEAKALNEYFATCRDQNPAPFVMLSRGLHMVVAYDKSVLDPSDAAVADRFRKQAKTRAVRLVKEAIENPSLNMSSALLRGHVGASRPADLLDPYLESRCVVAPKELEMEAGQGGRCFIFAAKHKKPEQPTPPQQPTPAAAAAAAVTAASMQERDRHSSSDGGDAAPTRGRKRASEEGGSASGCYFPVSLYITAVGDGPLAAGLSDKARERLEAILTKIPKEQQTTVECGGETAQLKLRVFVANSEDAKAVGDYIKEHGTETPSAVVLLCRDVPLALRCDAALDVRDSAVADRLRKQAKTRAVKLVRDMVLRCRDLSLPLLRGHGGALAPSQLLEPPIIFGVNHSCLSVDCGFVR
eukprot:CAMPEP_0113676654 /NCGR_PEP_ID=MMETSP0038_2-20120614/8771_1 /TAXON_ID=2898 /ORGANISM="Cryptomonas paramecium" /LENGTH=469 /DNA_ID=CAMNT_0000593723 /DNA_START=232 /DNA_END=1641 /DNA_ORIENTATION=+ /assembly_acc=CAM_ASM_000170